MPLGGLIEGQGEIKSIDAKKIDNTIKTELLPKDQFTFWMHKDDMAQGIDFNYWKAAPLQIIPIQARFAVFNDQASAIMQLHAETREEQNAFAPIQVDGSKLIKCKLVRNYLHQFRFHSCMIESEGRSGQDATRKSTLNGLAGWRRKANMCLSKPVNIGDMTE